VTAALPTIMVVDIWQHTPFALFLCLAGLKGLPPEPFEAARIDGATPWQVVRHLTIPLLRPVILVILAIRSYDVLKTFDTVYVLTGGGPADASTVLSVLLYREAFVQLNTGYAAALSWVVLLVTLGVVVAYFVALRGGGE
jgi:multiple sugar transport system permease protein